MFEPWPAKARYGPQLTKADLPAGQYTEEGQAFIRDWLENVGQPYRDAVIEAIVVDPVAAGKRFAEWKLRCCMCGKALTNEESKVYGIGTECRRGIPTEVLARYLTPEVGRLHAEYLV